MKKLSKDQEKRKEAIAQALRDAAIEVEDAVEKFNAATSAAFEPVEAAIDKYNELLETAAELTAEVAADIQGYMDDRSEKWHEGEAGQAYECWRSTWESVGMSTVSLDMPGELECPEMAHADEIENLNDAPDEA